MKKNVYIIGAYSTQFKKWPDRSFKDLVKEAYLGVLKDASMENGDDFEFAYFANSAMGLWGQDGTRGQICFIPLVREGLFPERIPLINVEGACTSGSMAFHSAWKDILSGESQVTLALGVEKMFFEDDKEKIFRFLEQGGDSFDRDEMLEPFRDSEVKCGKKLETGPGRSFFMDLYAVHASYHMKKYGTTQRQIAIAASKNHHNGSLNPKAQYQFEVSVEEILEDRMVSYPFTRAMCAPIGDGSAAVVLCAEEYLKNLPTCVRDRAVKVRASAMTGGKYKSFDEPSLSRVAADRAYLKAGVGPEDIDVAEIHDATSFAEIYQAEMLRFCSEGEGGKFIESGATMLDGKIPINTSGGLVSKGHPVGATGLSMIYELCTQLRGEAGPRQIKDAEFALQENAGGQIGAEEAICSVIILQKDR